MTPSKEVRDATGEGPERKKAKSAVELLQEKRQSLAAAHAKYAAALRDRDELAMVDASRLIASLTVLRVELEAEVAAAAEKAASEQAEKRILGISRAVGS